MYRNIILICLLFINVQSECQNERLKVTVFYESLCYDSMVFIARQLYPSYEFFKNYIDLHMVPYGKAFQSSDKSEIACQHGPNECFGNKAQSCALEDMVNKDLKISFIACVMSSRNPASINIITNCAKNFKLNSTAITNCIKDKETDILVERMGNLTDSLNPQLSFVPTITFNDIHDPEIQDDILNKFHITVCKKLGPCAPSNCLSKNN